MTNTTNSQGYDPRARAVAQAVYDAVHPLAVILFGSRARGDYRDDSDVDLLVITGDGADDRATYANARAAAHRKLDELYDLSVGVDVLRFTKSRFAYCRRARNHVAGQALRDGVIVSEADFSPADFPANSSEEPANWPDIRVAAIHRCHPEHRIYDQSHHNKQSVGRHRLSRPASRGKRSQSLDFSLG